MVLTCIKQEQVDDNVMVSYLELARAGRWWSDGELPRIMQEQVDDAVTVSYLILSKS